jgi:hypothetical protein
LLGVTRRPAANIEGSARKCNLTNGELIDPDGAGR